jgi:hypothetical protein
MEISIVNVMQLHFEYNQEQLCIMQLYKPFGKNRTCGPANPVHA